MHRNGSSNDRTCLKGGCGLQRKRGIPVCAPHWRRVPFDLKERLREARGSSIQLESRDVSQLNATDDMEYISAMHAVVEYLEGGD